MADILLSAGLDTGSINAAQFQKDLKTALAGVEIPKVGVGIEVSKESIAVFRSQLQRIVNSITLDSGSLIRIDVGDLGSVTTKIDKASDSLERLSRAAKNTKMSDLGVDKIVGAQTAIDKLITKLEKLRSTKPGGDLGKNIESQLAALRALRDGLAGMGAMDYAKEYQYAKTAVDALVTSQQRLNAEAMNTPLV